MPHTSASTKVIGYFVPERSDHLIGEIDWTAFSHVNIIGISPDTDGNWALGGGREAGVLIPLIKSKNPDIRILATVAGAADIYEDWIEQLNGKNRSTLIAGLIRYLGNSGYRPGERGSHSEHEYSIIKEIENSLNDPGREALTSGDAST